ncbi:MAG: restriction endonuclease subunit S [Actinomycetota bacterium]
MSRYPLLPLSDALVSANDQVNVELTTAYEVAGVLGFGRGLLRRESITGARTSYKVLHRLHAGQLVVSRLKAFEGAIAVVPTEFDGTFVSQEFPTFDPVPGRCDSRYLSFLCRWPTLWDQLRQQSRGIGARRERVHADDVLRLRVPLPPIDEQRRIATHLDKAVQSLAAAKVASSRQGELLRALMPSILRPLASANGGRNLRFGGDIEVASGGTPSTSDPECWDGDVVWVTPADLGKLKGRDILDSERHITEAGLVRSSARPVPVDSVVMSSRAPIGHLGIARVPLATNQGCKIFLPHPEVVSEYLYFVLRARMDEIAKAGSGTTFSEVSMRKLAEFSVAVPTLDEQRELAAEMASLQDAGAELRTRWTDAKRLLEALQPSVLNDSFSS